MHITKRNLQWSSSRSSVILFSYLRKTQSYLMRALNLRQKVLFASQEFESALKYDPVLVQVVFLHVVENGLRNDNIRNKIRPVLSQAHVQDEELMHQITIALLLKKSE